ncbi:hypothetical protein ES703_30239 [subsurface metagenome]
MNITDLQWPGPGDPQKIARFADEGNRGLIVARHGRRVYDWDMDRLGETLIPYITTVYVPGKLAGDPKLVEANNVTLYHMTGSNSMQELFTVPFFSPPLPLQPGGEWPRTPLQDVAGSMVVEAKRIMTNLSPQRTGEPLLKAIATEVGKFLSTFRRN